MTVVLPSYTKGSGTTALTFSYTVAAGQNTPDLTVTGLDLAGGATIKDAAGNNAVLSGADTTRRAFSKSTPRHRRSNR